MMAVQLLWLCYDAALALRGLTIALPCDLAAVSCGLSYGLAMVLLWLCHGSAMALLWSCFGFAMDCYGLAMALL